MVVEDDREIRESIVDVLVDNEFKPLGAANGKEAIDQLRARPLKPCVILLDIMMPVMDGWQFRALQRQDPELDGIPVVVLTAHANNRTQAEGMEPAAWLNKPVPVDLLLDTIKRFCRQADAA
jgi:CheY-like chemotaxis protein